MPKSRKVFRLELGPNAANVFFSLILGITIMTITIAYIVIHK